MKRALLILMISFAPASAFAWAAYDMGNTVYESDSQDEAQDTLAQYDPAMVPLDDYYVGVDEGSNESSSTNSGILDAD